MKIKGFFNANGAFREFEFEGNATELEHLDLVIPKLKKGLSDLVK